MPKCFNNAFEALKSYGQNNSHIIVCVCGGGGGRGGGLEVGLKSTSEISREGIKQKENNSVLCT